MTSENTTIKRDYFIQQFNGFYETIWYNCNTEYNWVEDVKRETGVQLDIDDFKLNHKEFFDAVGKGYTSHYCQMLQEIFGETFSLEFDHISSPREYNFSTDQICCKITIPDPQKFFDGVKQKMRDYYDELKEYIVQNHTSYSGFTSTMSNNVDEWFDLIEQDNKPYLECVMYYLLRIDLDTTAYENESVDEIIHEDLSCNGVDAESFIIPITDKGRKDYEKAMKIINEEE